tara:strand:+ start:580 stop:855 length:276 start_codon:yes stop_codon:yes gene_type:complete
MTKTKTRAIGDLDKSLPNGVKKTVSQQELLDLKDHGFADEYINKHFKVQRNYTFTQEQVRQSAVRVMYVMAALSQSERARVLRHALKLNEV